MKRCFLPLVGLLLLSTVAFSQLSLRPQVGINFSEFTDEIIHGEFDGEVGYQFGADLQFGQDWYGQIGLNFQTTKLSIQHVGDMKVSRINVPFVGGYKFFENKNGGTFGVRAYIGMNFAFNINKDLDSAFSGFDGDNIEDFMISGIFGAGFDIHILFVDVMYKNGFSNWFDSDNTDGMVNLWIANAGVRIGF